MPSAKDYLIESALRAYDALRELAKREPKEVRSFFRDYPQVLSDLGLEPFRGPGRPRGSFRLLSKTDRLLLFVWRAKSLGMTAGQIIRDLGRPNNSASKRFVKEAIARVNRDDNFDRMKLQIVEDYETSQQVGAALRSFRRH